MTQFRPVGRLAGSYRESARTNELCRRKAALRPSTLSSYPQQSRLLENLPLRSFRTFRLTSIVLPSLLSVSLQSTYELNSYGPFLRLVDRRCHLCAFSLVSPPSLSTPSACSSKPSLRIFTLGEVRSRSRLLSAICAWPRSALLLAA